jgi:hypothetical protein
MLFVLAKFTTCRDFLEKKIGQFKTKILTKNSFLEKITNKNKALILIISLSIYSSSNQFF